MVKETEMMLRYVRIAFKRQEPPAPVVGGAPLPMQTEIKDAIYPAGYSGGKYGGLDVAMDATDNFTLSQGQAIAQLVFEQAENAVWSGSHQLGALALDLRPGLRYNVSGSRADYESMNAPIQRVVDDFAARTTTVEFGPPSQLAAQDFLERLRDLRNLMPTLSPGEVEEQETGVTDENTYSMGNKNSDPKYSKQLKLPAGPVSTGPYWLKLSGGSVEWEETVTTCP